MSWSESQRKFWVKLPIASLFEKFFHVTSFWLLPVTAKIWARIQQNVNTYIVFKDKPSSTARLHWKIKQISQISFENIASSIWKFIKPLTYHSRLMLNVLEMPLKLFNYSTVIIRLIYHSDRRPDRQTCFIEIDTG